MEQDFSEFRESDKSLKYDPGSVIASWSLTQEVVGSNPCSEMTNIFYRPQRSWGQGYIFTGVCDSVHGGAACVAGVGGSWRGACMAGRGVCVAGRACMIRTPPGRYYGYGIRSMSGRYAPYWNAFLLSLNLSNSLKAFRELK